MALHQYDATTKVSTTTLTNDEHNGSFEDEDIDDEHSNAIDHPDSKHHPQINGGTIVKAYVLYDFNGKIKQRLTDLERNLLCYILRISMSFCR
jgi:hypothetical protein